MADYQEFLDGVDRAAYHEGEWRWEEDGYTVTRTYHYSPPGCHTSCGILLYEKDGKVRRVEGDPLDPCTNGKLCIKCLTLDESLNHPDRLKYPLRRFGERGQDRWERISWDEAYDEITERVLAIKEEHGSESIVVVHGTGRNIGWQVPYFASACMETPNVSTFGFTGFACYLPRMIGTSAKYGDMIIVDASQAHPDRYANPDWQAPGVVLVWGNEPIKSNADGFLGHWLVQCVQMGSKIVFVDPRLTWWGARAAYWLPVRPGTDAVAAMALLNVVIEEDLYDHDFVDRWCYGFEALAERVADKTPEWAAPICEVDAEALRGAARLIATSSSCACQWGLAFEQQIAALGVTEAVADLMAITGNIDNPGGNALYRCAFLIEKRYGLGDEYIDPEVYAKKLIPATSGINESNIVSCADTDAILAAIETGEPYPIKAMFMMQNNAIACMGAQPQRILPALQKMEFNVVVDLFLTPTALACADVLLPAACFAERIGITGHQPYALGAIAQAVEPLGECKSDQRIIYETGSRFTDEAHKKWDDEQGFYDYLLRKTGYTYETLRERTWAYPEFEYNKHEKGLLRRDGTVGFATSTGRYNFYCPEMLHFGLSPLADYEEPPESPVSAPELAEKYPLVLTTGARPWGFFHSEHRQSPSMRRLHPDPTVLIHPETAAAYGIADGDWVTIENNFGSCRQKAELTTRIRKDTVSADHAWWFPERGPEDGTLFGVMESNINKLVPMRPGKVGLGASYKSQLCTIGKVEE